MTPLSKIVRRTLIGVAFLAILLLGFGVFDPSTETTAVSLLVQLVLLAILIAGLIPRSYIQRLADSLAGRAEARRRSTLILLATLGPFLLVLVFGLGIYNAVDTLRFIEQFGGGAFDVDVPRFDIVRYSVLGLFSFALFVSNLVTLLRANSEREALS